ncbi:MAG: hypothetical protein II179_02505 [Alphaproteobacteria bacterium]|nr:hypothetical protein [Alphaproteobacteria bacterium]
MKAVTMKHDIILGQQQDTVVISVPEYKINRAKTNQKPTKQNPTQSVEYNRLHRSKVNSMTAENQDTERKEPQEAVTIATTKEATTIITKRKPKHTRMQPMTGGKRRTNNQELQKITASNTCVNGVFPFDIFWWSRYDVTEEIERKFPEIFNLPLANTQQKITPSWQKEIQKTAKKLKSAEEELKSAKKSPLGQDYIDILQEDYDALQQQFYQLIARHQQSFNNPKDYTKQIRADRRRAKQLMHGTPKEQLPLADFYELYVEEPIDTPIIDACLEAEEPAIKEQLLQAWRDAQKQARQLERFAECMRSLYYEK